MGSSASARVGDLPPRPDGAQSRAGHRAVSRQGPHTIPNSPNIHHEPSAARPSVCGKTCDPLLPLRLCGEIEKLWSLCGSAARPKSSGVSASPRQDLRSSVASAPLRRDQNPLLPLRLCGETKTLCCLCVSAARPEISVASVPLRRNSPRLPANQSAITGFNNTPSPSTSTSTTSPGLRKTGGFRAKPTPGGVPVAMTSPGSSVTVWERNDTT
jgi:hypothetical protein